MSNNIKKFIDESISDTQEDGRRDHLGASLVGGMCLRKTWYDWRWAKNEKHSARMVRLFNRGHREEERFEEWLNNISDKFWSLDPDTNRQIRISDYHGYFGGSLDGVALNPADLEGAYLCEFKTHNAKSYEKLVVEGVKKSKPEHYTQMQIYLKYKPKLKAALYFAINKNDDNLYVEIVERDEEWQAQAMKNVETILTSKLPPDRHEKASEYNYYCKYFCNYTDTCFKEKAPDVSCRTCASIRVKDQGWTCGKFNHIISSEDQKLGCDKYERLF